MTPQERALLLALMTGVDPGQVRVLPRRPAWWADAACRGRSDIEFFLEPGQSAAPAKAVCAECPARDACLAYANEENIDHGIFGGKSAIERRRARAGGPRRPAKRSLAGASGRWRDQQREQVDLDALGAQAAGWRRKAEAARAKRAG